MQTDKKNEQIDDAQYEKTKKVRRQGVDKACEFAGRGARGTSPTAPSEVVMAIDEEVRSLTVAADEGNAGGVSPQSTGDNDVGTTGVTVETAGSSGAKGGLEDTPVEGASDGQREPSLSVNQTRAEIALDVHAKNKKFLKSFEEKLSIACHQGCSDDNACFFNVKARIKRTDVSSAGQLKGVVCGKTCSFSKCMEAWCSTGTLALFLSEGTKDRTPASTRGVTPAATLSEDEAVSRAACDVERLARARSDKTIAQIQLQLTQLQEPVKRAQELVKWRQEQAESVQRDADSLAAHIGIIQANLDGALATRELGVEFVPKTLPPIQCSHPVPPTASPRAHEATHAWQAGFLRLFTHVPQIQKESSQGICSAACAPADMTTREAKRRSFANVTSMPPRAAAAPTTWRAAHRVRNVTPILNRNWKLEPLSHFKRYMRDNLDPGLTVLQPSPNATSRTRDLLGQASIPNHPQTAHSDELRAQE